MDPTALPSCIGRYQLLGALGQGAMGRVLLAEDPILRRQVAVKLLRADLDLPDEQREALLGRMRQEARASARVSHPNIVALHDMGDDPEVGLYLVFEYAEGTTLKEKLTRGALGPNVAAQLSREMGDALTTLHEAGVLHRDIKPENIILTPTGSKLADFGIARVPDSTLTRDGGLLGTPAYSSPESIKHGTFSPSSDQFSMASTLYEALSGRRAFPGDDAVGVATRITTDEPPPFARSLNLDPHIDAIFARAFAKGPAERFPCAADFGNALAEALARSSRDRLPTVPDEYHTLRDLRDRTAQRLRLGLASGAVGALLAVIVMKLGEHSPADPDSASSLSRSESVAMTEPRERVGYLAEAPPKHRPSRNERSDAGARPSDGPKGAERATSLVETDAGTLTPSDAPPAAPPVASGTAVPLPTDSNNP